MMRVAITVLSVSLVVGVRLDDDIAADPSTTAAASSSSPQAAQEDMAAKSAVTSFANLMKDTSAPDTIPEVPYSFKRYMLPTEEKYPDCVTEPETHADIMGQLEADVNRELDRPAVGLASDVGSEAGRLAIGAGYAPEKVACVAAKMVLGVGGSHAESIQAGDLLKDEASDAAKMRAKALEVVAQADAASAVKPSIDTMGMAPQTMLAAQESGVSPSTVIQAGGDSSDAAAESQQIVDDLKKATDASTQRLLSAPQTAGSAYSLSEAGTKDKKASSTAAAFDAIKKLVDSVKPGAKAAKK